MTARRVYRGMYRGTVCLLLSLAAVAQVPQREPFDAALQAFWTARNAGHFDEATAKREEARQALRFGQIESPIACLECHPAKDVPWVQAQLRSWSEVRHRSDITCCTIGFSRLRRPDSGAAPS